MHTDSPTACIILPSQNHQRRERTMGRRPNQLILEYFERGPKLEDASNRYQHTCKSCGERFAKGRIDSLTSHLRALLQFHELPLPDSMANGHGQMHTGQNMRLPYAPSKQLSALETLAEVSRQHLDLSGKRVQDKHGLLDEFLVHDDRPEGAHDMAGLSQGDAPALPSVCQFPGPLHHSPTNSPHMGHMPLSGAASMAHMAPSLVMAASAANELMPLTNGLTGESDMSLGSGINGMSDKLFHTQGRSPWPPLQPSPLESLLQDHGKHPLLPKDEHSTHDMSHARPLAMNPSTQAHFTTDFSMNQKPLKPKVRGRFSDSRRKEVQEVRKRGACIRCRMLKKPCSGENPCNTCQNVESARLWKQPCIRTRIAEEFNLYSAGLHGVLAYHVTNQAKGQIRLDQTPGRIEATHHPDSGIFATFTPLKCQHAQASQNADIDPAMFGAIPSPDVELIDGDDDIGGKLDLYIKKISPYFFDTEDSPFMKTTQRTASSMIPPNNTNPDGLLPKALELWTYTRILTSPDTAWHLFSNPSLAPTLTPAVLSPPDSLSPPRTPISPFAHPTSHNLIKAQLLGAAEKRAAALSRTLMNDLERRLLQRQQANPFETFLVAVILLACVERMCWLFRTWELPTDAATRNPKWPLDKPPAFFSQQGERFSDTVNMLLKMRGVPPKPVPRSGDGVLVVWGEEGDGKVREWYEGIGVSGGMLDERAAARFVGEGPREWELKFVGKIIRGD
ncbi:hypothetical protein P153DRAFT_394666 [Dothidotthia symphoricarpi CBS 119687]|uniref:Zn(2)-C6 fungal-type domain-containing protein n=1 Tax=Dothidotthia symphoricarpi CBS 119687 TaxID=1392245 RepID=A0A6A6AIC0_9PLEO|nr:uncharacterized protein P153DRAFT_394666 [Dothidotthia symphoricarpi CBS 119687]KAF2131316.1 hypothetical protein P153DRAFT_394666 [Dothidotthia symphoricarpi CBS 119687]